MVNDYFARFNYLLRLAAFRDEGNGDAWMKKVRLLAVLGVVTCPVLANAGWFGPSTYEECVIDGMKSAKSAAAANAINAACYSKFASTVQLDYAGHHEFSKLSAYRPTLEALINNVTITHLSKFEKPDTVYIKPGSGWVSGTERYLEVEIQNRNTFPIVGIELGIPKYIVCSSNVNDYSEIYSCSGAVGAYKSKVYKCDIPRLDSRKITELCVTGFAYSATDAEAVAFMKKYKIPPLRR